MKKINNYKTYQLIKDIRDILKNMDGKRTHSRKANAEYMKKYRLKEKKANETGIEELKKRGL